jgi:hypothetical protein
MNLELHYSDGGHGGPYPSMSVAIARAIALINGSGGRTRRIDIRDGVNGSLRATVALEAGPDVIRVYQGDA